MPIKLLIILGSVKKNWIRVLNVQEILPIFSGQDLLDIRYIELPRAMENRHAWRYLR